LNSPQFDGSGKSTFFLTHTASHGFCKSTFPPILLKLLLSKVKWKFYRDQLLTEMAQNLGKCLQFCVPNLEAKGNNTFGLSCQPVTGVKINCRFEGI